MNENQEEHEGNPFLEEGDPVPLEVRISQLLAEKGQHEAHIGDLKKQLSDALRESDKKQALIKELEAAVASIELLQEIVDGASDESAVYEAGLEAIRHRLRAAAGRY